MPAVRLCANDGAVVTITLFGAQVVSWTSAQGVEQLYLSPSTVFDGVAPVRGGVPVVFPQFNTRGPLPRHGFARTANWSVLEAAVSEGECSVTLALSHTAHTQALWPHAFGCTLTVSLQDADLSLCMVVRNEGAHPFGFQAALHTYLAVGSIDGLSLTGLQACAFEDCTATVPGTMKPHAHWQAPAPMDRIYYNAPQQLQLHSEMGQRSLQQTGFTDTVVWNPGLGAAGTPADLPPDGHRHFVCVEAAQIGQPVVLQAGQSWCGTQTMGCAQ